MELVIRILFGALIAIAVALVLFRPQIDRWHIRQIRRACELDGYEEISIKTWSGHYGVRAKKDGVAVYRKAGVWLGKVTFDPPTKKEPIQLPETTRGK